MVEHYVRDVGAAGSNPVTSTILGHTKKMTHQKTTEIPWFFAFYRAKKVPSEPWMTLGVFERLTRFELSSQGFEGENKG